MLIILQYITVCADITHEFDDQLPELFFMMNTSSPVPLLLPVTFYGRQSKRYCSLNTKLQLQDTDVLHEMPSDSSVLVIFVTSDQCFVWPLLYTNYNIIVIDQYKTTTSTRCSPFTRGVFSTCDLGYICLVFGLAPFKFTLNLIMQVIFVNKGHYSSFHFYSSFCFSFSFFSDAF